MASGTRKLPDNLPPFITLYVYATGNVTLTDAAGVTVATLAAGELAACMPLTATTWAASIFTAGALEINTAADVPIADAGGFTANTNVETVTQELLARSVFDVNTTYNNTDGTGTLTGVAMLGGVITRTGETAAYTDTTAIADDLYLASRGDGYSWYLLIKNSSVPPNNCGRLGRYALGADGGASEQRGAVSGNDDRRCDRHDGRIGGDAAVLPSCH